MNLERAAEALAQADLTDKHKALMIYKLSGRPDLLDYCHTPSELLECLQAGIASAAA